MKNKKNSFKNVNETIIEEAEEECGMTKTSENKCEKTDFEEEPSKQSYLSAKEKEKEKIMTSWKTHTKICLKEKLDTAQASRQRCGSKKEETKGTNSNLIVLPKHVKNL